MLRTLALALALLAGLPALAAPVSLDRLSAYLNGITTAEARFTQYNADGTRSGGTVYISRPGRMRFEYDAPNDALVLANSGQVAVFDAKSNAEPQQFPLSRTPLNLILGRQIDLKRARLVQSVRESQDGQTVVLARDPDHPDSGTIELYFSARPLALRRWVITDETGSKTAVDLAPFATGKSYANNFFSINAEAGLRNR